MKIIICWLLLSLITVVSCMDTYDYVIVGAGITGVSAGRLLADNNQSFIILEGNNRYGGRVHSVKGPSGFPYPVDMGAVWEHHKNINPMYNLTLESGLPLMLFDQGNSGVFDGGRKLSQSQVIKFVGRYLAYYDAANQYRANNVSDEQAFAYAGYTGGDNRIEIVIQFYEEQWSGNNSKYHNSNVWDNRTDAELGPDYIIPTGYIKIFDYMMDKSPSFRENILLNSLVTNINYAGQSSEKAAIITYTNTINGQSYQVKARKGVMITVSIGVLRYGSITFAPSLPTAHLNAINKLMFSAVNKVALFFDSVGEDLLTDNKLESNYLFRVPYGAQPRYNDPLTCFINWEHVLGQPVITSFYQGDASHAFEMMTDAQVISAHMTAIRDIIPNMPDPIHYIISRWGQDPFTRGSYTDFAVGSTVSDMEQLQVPFGENNNILLAGEASNYPDHGTVYAGYIAGRQGVEYLLSL